MMLIVIRFLVGRSVACLLLALLLVSCSKQYEFNKVRLGMSVAELEALGEVKEQINPLRSMTMPEVRFFRFKNSSHNSVTVRGGLVTEIHWFEFEPKEDLETRKAALIKFYGKPSSVSSATNFSRVTIYWGKVKPTENGRTAKGNHVVAEVGEGITRVDIIKGTSKWEDYSPVIVM